MSTKRATLYLLVGYPGSGKTTASQIIHDLSGAVHIWADYERRAMFGRPTHSPEESRKLYAHLNQSAELLLSDGQSVIFDTNFNFRKDRELLRSIAEQHGAETRLIWIKAPKPTARKRALSDTHAIDNKYSDSMSADDFERITGNLQAPTKEEEPIILDGTRITPEYVAGALHLQIKKPRRLLTKLKHKITSRTKARS